jgi:quercetin dioxygenase-like cupin family protein
MTKHDQDGTILSRGDSGVPKTMLALLTGNSLAVDLTVVLAFAVAVHSAAAGEVTEKGITHQLITTERLANAPGQTFTAVRVDLAPGGTSPPHRHPGFVFAYVLSGTVRSQLNDGPATEYGPGQSWVEPPATLHRLTQNPSAFEPASLLAVWVATDGAKLVVPPEE